MTNGTDATSERSRAADLRVARRVDWRFLLDDPSLGDVALAGPPDAGLRAALDALARSLGRDEVDVAVLARGTTEADIRAAAARVRSSGQVVAESSGLLGWRPGHGVRPMDVRRVTRALRAAGFGSVTTWVMWPTHERPTAMIPAHQATSVAAWLARKLDGRLWRLVAFAGSVGARSGLIDRLAPSVVVVARRTIDPGAANSWLAERLPTTSVIALTPRFGASGHVVALGDLAVAPCGRPQGRPPRRRPRGHPSRGSGARRHRTRPRSHGSRTAPARGALGRAATLPRRVRCARPTPGSRRRAARSA